MFDCHLIIEDHDKHHRQGCRTSGNYGKQTRLWDRVFGTCKDRIECRQGNIDWDSPVPLPLF
jgi:sterol desaturase/sphingolipid hydroxylase (fatty acid hydroxylase superfamily)